TEPPPDVGAEEIEVHADVACACAGAEPISALTAKSATPTTFARCMMNSHEPGKRRPHHEKRPGWITSGPGLLRSTSHSAQA
ncbi:MAG: hypothetical protein ACRD1T_12520, partial [Acidimicrobiia bacterium]